MDEDNDSVRKSWIVFRHENVAKLTSAVEFSAARRRFSRARMESTTFIYTQGRVTVFLLICKCSTNETSPHQS